MGAFDDVDAAIAAERRNVAPGASAPAADMSTKYGPPPPAAPPAPPTAAYRGSILPFSKDEKGNISFDPLGSGITGAMYQAFTLPGRVYRGETKVDPSDPRFMGEVMNFAGSFGGGVNPAVRSGDRAIPGVVRNAPDPLSVPAPTGAKLLETGGRQLNEFRDMPVRYNPEHAPVLAQQIENKLIDEGVFAHESPGLYAALARLRNNKPQQPGDDILFTPANLHSLRKNIANQFGKQNENQHGVGVAFNLVDDFIKNPPASAVLAGPAAEAGAVFESGLGNYAAGMRDKELQNIKRTADLRAASANSGQNTDNTLRSRITSHILDQKKIRGYTDPEVAMLEGIPEGTTANNILRAGGNILGGGGGAVGTSLAGMAAYGLGNMFGLGQPAATAFGVAAPIVGNIMKRAAGKGTREALDEASQTMRQRSPLFQESVKAYGAPADPARDAMARTLLRLETQGTGGVPPEAPASDEDLSGIPRIRVTPR